MNFTYIVILIIIVIIFFYTNNNYESFINYKLKNVNIQINNDELNVVTHRDRGLYTSYNIKTFDTWISYFNKIYECISENPLRNTVLILGFGMGAIPQRLSKDKYVSKIDCVDNDDELFSYFKKIFPLYSSKINLHYSDANKFLKKCVTKYDIIIDDVFDGLNKIELDYSLIKKLLNKDGVLYLNNYDKNFRNIRIVKKIKTIFGNGLNKPLKITPNHILHAKNITHPSSDKLFPKDNNKHNTSSLYKKVEKSIEKANSEFVSALQSVYIFQNKI